RAGRARRRALPRPTPRPRTEPSPCLPLPGYCHLELLRDRQVIRWRGIDWDVTAPWSWLLTTTSLHLDPAARGRPGTIKLNDYRLNVLPLMPSAAAQFDDPYLQFAGAASLAGHPDLELQLHR